jgi:AcrR family transcriptional regulator
MAARGADTRERILDAAEELFAQRGYAATPLEDIAGGVGIRGPAIFRHFKNKQALYEAVVDRLMEGSVDLLRPEIFREAPLELLDEVFTLTLQRPNLARILQHASLANDERFDYVVKRWLRPLMDEMDAAMGAELALAKSEDFSLRTIMMMFLTMMWGYVSMEHVNAEVFGIDPMSPERRREARRLLAHFGSTLLRESD